VVHRLGHVGRENAVTLSQGNTVVLIFLDGRGQGIDDLLSALPIAIRDWAGRGHAHMSGIHGHVVTVGHRLHGARLGVVG
jgi:hypothetical protein